jgi:glycosyltransferase 2 family protein
VRERLLSLLRRRSTVVALQLLLVGLIFGFLGWYLRDVWDDALPRLRDADLVEVTLALLVLAAYYLLFVIGWQWILAALGVRIGYRLALQAEMASMLAKYVPGAVWTPLARIVWLRRAGEERSLIVFSSVALEAGLSAIAGVLVFVAGLPFVSDADAPLVPLTVFAAVVIVLVHPRVYLRLARFIFRRFGSDEEPLVLSYRTMFGLLGFYSVTWLVGGAALFFLVRAVGGDPDWDSIPYLGGVAAVGAIVAVLSVLAPSGLGVREGSMYGLLLAVAGEGVALGATLLNRLAITLVEILLLAFGILAWRLRPAGTSPTWSEPELAER